VRKVLRTPDDCFENLPGYAYEPHYLTIDDMRMHYVDEGSGEPVLLLHGEPSWSYLYRHMIGPIVDAGFRAIAPDLFGFGRSDKPADRADYTYAGHVAWVRAFVEALDLEGITLVCQDWGSLIGLRLAAEHEHRFARVVLANGGLPDGNQEMPKAFHVWRTYSQTSPDFPIGDIIQRSTVTDLPPDVVGAYDAPFPSDDFKAGARQFPALVPIRPDDPASAANQAAWQVLTRWDKPFLTAFSDSDPITQGADRVFQKHVPGARDQAHTIIEGGGHFLQEDRGPELAGVVIDFMRENPRGE
jgi:haloalkane dehalogenase